MLPYQLSLFPGYQQRDRQPLPAILPPHDDVYQNADESQPLTTSDSQSNSPQHMANQMMVTPAVSKQVIFYSFYFPISLFLILYKIDYLSLIAFDVKF